MKGKQAAASARRRSDGLQEQLDSERARRRAAETELRAASEQAARVGPLLERNEQLAAQVEAGTSDEVERLGDMLNEQRGELAARDKRLTIAERHTTALIRRNRISLTDDEFGGLAAAFGCNVQELLLRLDGKGHWQSLNAGMTEPPTPQERMLEARGFKRRDLFDVPHRAALEEIHAAYGEGKSHPDWWRRRR